MTVEKEMVFGIFRRHCKPRYCFTHSCGLWWYDIQIISRITCSATFVVCLFALDDLDFYLRSYEWQFLSEDVCNSSIVDGYRIRRHCLLAWLILTIWGIPLRNPVPQPVHLLRVSCQSLILRLPALVSLFAAYSFWKHFPLRYLRYGWVHCPKSWSFTMKN